MQASSGGFQSSSDGQGPRRRGRQSKDEHLASSNNLPITAREIAEMTLSELQKMLKSERLTEQQKMLIKKIRRRGESILDGCFECIGN